MAKTEMTMLYTSRQHAPPSRNGKGCMYHVHALKADTTGFIVLAALFALSVPYQAV